MKENARSLSPKIKVQLDPQSNQSTSATLGQSVFSLLHLINQMAHRMGTVEFGPHLRSELSQCLKG